jgi:Polyketide cyclase / dehydrase and lipid transport
MIRGEGTEVIEGVTPQEVFDFVLDPAQYTKADTKILWVTKLGDIPNGMIAREDGTFLGVAKGSVVTRYIWEPPHKIDVVLEHGFIRGMHAWFEIEAVERGTRIHHVEEVDFGWGPLGLIHDALIRGWWERSVRQEVSEIARLMRAGERGKGLAAV